MTGDVCVRIRGLNSIRVAWLAMTAIPVIFGCLAFSQARSNAADAIASALRNEQYNQALELLRPALQQSSGDGQLWTMQGVAYSKLGNKKEALTAFRHALKIAPDNIPALQGAAQIEFDSGSAAGIPLLERILRLHPSDLTSHAMLAVLEYQQGNCAAAVPHFAKADSLFSSQLPALHAYATCLVKLKRIDEAIPVFQRTLALNDDQRERQLLASLQLMAHKPEDAIGTLEPLLGNSPNVDTLELASAAYENTHDTAKAVESLQRAIVINPQKVDLYVDFAILSSAHQSFQVGINAVNDGIALLPNAAALYFARGVLYVQLAEYEKAQADFEKAYELDPNQSMSVAAQGLAAVQRNDLDGALAGVREKLKRKPDDPVLLYLQADILTQKGAEPGSPEFQTAMQSAEKAVALRPALGPPREVLAKLYLQAEQYSEAAIQCRKALEIDPKDQTALYRLIQALRKTEKKDEIPALLKRLASLRQEATKEEREQYRYKLVEETPAK
jgi:tetratricopeptide (TPR) repeat protein